MDTLRHSGHSTCNKTLKFAATPGARSTAAFSLVEMTVAIGIVAFAFLGVFGLIPFGLNTFHQAINFSVGSNIAGKVIREAQQTDFSTLINNNSVTFQQSSTPRFFDEQGNELTTSAKAVYLVNTCITPSTPILGSGGVTNPNLATVAVQIANNPAHLAISIDAATKLWNDPRIPTVTYSALVSRNK